jgi:hypothetical protein
MKLLTVPASRGVLWVRSGFRIFFSKPLGFAALFASFILAALFLLLVPSIGPLLVLIAMPLVSQGFMIGTQHALAGRMPMPEVFALPLRGPRSRAVDILKVGLIYGACSFLIMWISSVVDGGRFEVLQQAMGEETPDAARISFLLQDPMLLSGMLLRLALASLLSVPFWHAPALIHWDGQSVAQSLFSSTVGCWRNKGAFAVFGATWIMVIFALGVLLSTVFSLLLDSPHLVPMAALPAGLMFSTVFYASLYFTFVDCFGDPESTPEPAL